MTRWLMAGVGAVATVGVGLLFLHRSARTQDLALIASTLTDLQRPALSTITGEGVSSALRHICGVDVAGASVDFVVTRDAPRLATSVGTYMQSYPQALVPPCER